MLTAGGFLQETQTHAGDDKIRKTQLYSSLKEMIEPEVAQNTNNSKQ